MSEESKARIYQYVADLTVAEKREKSLHKLSRCRESHQELAPILWHSISTTAALLQEIISIYPSLAPPTLNVAESNRVCNVLALLQCVASHHETRRPFLEAHIPLFLYPFLNTVNKNRPFEYLRLTSLGVIGAMVKSDDPDVINFLLQTEIIPLCLRIMERGTELSKTVATFIVQKILYDDSGLNYICQTYDRFYAVNNVLNSMVESIKEQPCARLLKHIIRCYLRLTEHTRARDIIKTELPQVLKDYNSHAFITSDESIRRLLENLMVNLNINLSQVD